jgi:hypothetical protein
VNQLKRHKTQDIFKAKHPGDGKSELEDCNTARWKSINRGVAWKLAKQRAFPYFFALKVRIITIS